MARALKMGGIALASLLGLLIVAAGILWIWPSLLLRPDMLQWVARRWLPEGTRVSWRAMSVVLRSPTWRTKQLWIEAEDLCVESRPSLEVCFPSALLDGRFGWWAGGLKVRAEEFVLVDGRLIYVAPAQARRVGAKPEPPGPPRVPVLPGWLEVGRLRVGLEEFRVGSGEGNPWAGAVALGARREGEGLSWTVKGEARSRPLALALEASGTWVEDRIQSKLSARVKLPGRFSAVALESGSLRVDFLPPYRGLALAGRVTARTRRGTAYLTRLSGQLEARARLRAVPEGPERISGTVRLALAPLLPGLRESTADLALDFDGLASEPPTRWMLSGRVRGRINRFQRLVALTRRSRFAVPAPFNALDGELSLEAEGRFDPAEALGKAPWRLTTRLLSRRQSLRTTAAGTLSLRPGPRGPVPHLEGNVELGDVKLVLPRLPLRAVPRLVPDPRIRPDAELREIAAATPPSFTYDVTVVTARGRPLRLVSNLAPRPVPVYLDLRFRSSGRPTGTVRVSDVTVDWFRRKAVIDHLNLRLVPGTDQIEVNGEIDVDYVDYDIRILVLGLADQPQIRFVSDPPLPENEVIAVLLFGRRLDALDPSRTASVASTQSAIADGAVSVASMYLLAATPIESVGYDPASRSLSARLRLGDGTSLTVGTNLRRLQQLGVRRQLGAHWAVVSYLENPFAPLERSFTAFLEWSTGY